jgi:hypothetical protein
MIPDKLDKEIEFRLKRAIPAEIRNQVSRLVKTNVWHSSAESLFARIKPTYETINLKEIKLVPYEEHDKPVVRYEQVYQICVLDWDNDCILKDDLNGVQIISNAFSDDSLYEMALIEFLPKHPLNTIFQIKYRDTILSGNSLELQMIVDLYYSNFYYI